MPTCADVTSARCDTKMKIVLAYSGGLDTSVLLVWLKEKYNAEIIAYCADVGQAEELDGVIEKALATGASKCIIGDLKADFAENYIFPILFASIKRIFSNTIIFYSPLGNGIVSIYINPILFTIFTS